MRAKILHSCKRSTGFTLIELLGVIAVIAMLTSIVLIAITGAIESSAIRSVDRQVQVFNSAYQTFIAAGGIIPGLNSDVEADVISQGGSAVHALVTPVQSETGGRLGPFLPNGASDEWLLPDNGIGKEIGGKMYYIGFKSGVGFTLIKPE